MSDYEEEKIEETHVDTDDQDEEFQNVLAFRQYYQFQLQGVGHMEWIKERMQEPSSYAAVGGVVMGVGILISQPPVIIVGMVGGVVGFLLKEKGVIQVCLRGGAMPDGVDVSIIDVFNAAWPVLVAIIGLIIVLAKMHGDLEVLKDKVKVLFELWNEKK